MLSLATNYFEFYLQLNPFSIKLILYDFKGGRMVEVKNEEQEETMREV